MKKTLSVVFIGLGSRGTVYANEMKNQGKNVRFVACADINPEKVAIFARKFGIPADHCYDSADALLACGQLADIAVIATPDRLHAAEAIAAMEKGYHLLLEKPVSPVLNECLKVAETAERMKKRVVVCHVLRYTGFYGRLKEIISSGEIGEPVCVNAFEAVHFWHQAHSFVRGNWRNCAESSPMILQKSCHDMDIILWLTGKHCKAVSSFGSLSYFKVENAPAGAPERCSIKCPEYLICPYSIENRYIKRAREEGNFNWPTSVVTDECTLEALERSLAEGPYGRCVYHCDNDVVDHQVVNLQLEDGVTVAFTMCAFTKAGGRTIRFMGTKGEIIGDMDKNTLSVHIFGGESRVEDTNNAATDNLGHGGGDYGLVRDLLSIFEDENGTRKSLTDIRDSIESHVVALAAEESRVNGGKVIDIEEFLK